MNASTNEPLAQPMGQQMDPQTIMTAPMQTPGALASLLPFPPQLQQMLTEQVLKTRPQRATDIWYLDKATGSVVVMRQGMQWQLNQTASTIWQRLGEPISGIVADFISADPETEPGDIRFTVVEFLLNAYSNGLIDLFPEEPLEGQGPGPQASPKQEIPKEKGKK